MKVGVFLGLLVLLLATPTEGPKPSSAIISIEKDLHFTTLDGKDALAPAGMYEVAQVGENRLRLVSAAGQLSIEIEARAVTNPEAMVSALALSIPSDVNQDICHIVLLLPGGKGLEASGTYSGKRPRGETPQLSSATLENALAAGRAQPPTSPSSSPEAPVAAAMITIERPVHFQGVDGTDVLAPPGYYEVDQDSETRLRLAPPGGELSPAFEARGMTHSESLDAAAALAVEFEEDKDALHVILLLPGGSGLQAVGSYSGIRPRGGEAPRVSAAVLAQLLKAYQPRPQNPPNPSATSPAPIPEVPAPPSVVRPKPPAVSPDIVKRLPALYAHGACLNRPGQLRIDPCGKDLPLPPDGCEFCADKYPEAAAYDVDFRKIPVPTTPEESEETRACRAKVVRDSLMGEALGVREGLVEAVLPGRNLEDNLAIAIARLETAKLMNNACLHHLGCDREEIDQIIRSVETFLLPLQVSSRAGTTALFEGEWDVALKGLVIILNRYREILSPKVYDHVLTDLLNQTGPPGDDSYTLIDMPIVPVPGAPGIPVKLQESENHILNLETSRYLTNQLRGYDNTKNKPYILAKLQRFLRNDFLEYNSRPYSRYSISAIENLYDYADDPEVKLGARLVLDYVSAKFAVSSNGLRRAVPYRRLTDKLGDTNLFDNSADPMTQRFMMLSGPPVFQRVGHHLNLTDFSYAMVGTYSVPPLIQDMIINRPLKPSYQRIHHDGLEIYAGTKEFHISAGGVWTEPYLSILGRYRDVDAGVPLPTTLMPTRGGLNRDSFVRIEGFLDSSQDRGMINSCVAPGFACGINPYIPPQFLPSNEFAFHASLSAAPEQGKLPIDTPLYHMKLGEVEHCGDYLVIDKKNHAEQHPLTCQGKWQFLNLHDFYVAVYSKNLPAQPLQFPKNSLGFFEAVPASAGLSFENCWKRVLVENDHSYSLENVNSYVTSSGTRIEFNPWPPTDRYHWGIVSIGGRRFEADTRTWPLAEGDIINSRGKTGYIEVRNPKLNEKLVLDFHDVLHPNRIPMEDAREEATPGVIEHRGPFLAAHGGPFFQNLDPTGSMEFHLLVAQKQAITDYSRDISTGPWHHQSGVTISLPRLLTDPKKQAGGTSSWSDRVISANLDTVRIIKGIPTIGTPDYISVAQGSFEFAQNSFEAVVHKRDLQKDWLDLYSYEKRSGKWSEPRRIDVDGETITGITGTPGLIRSTWGWKGDLELIVPQGNWLNHYYRDNDAPGWPWHKAARLPLAAVGKRGVAGLTEMTNSSGGQGEEIVVPEGVALIESVYGAGELFLEAIVQMHPSTTMSAVTPQIIGMTSTASDYLAYYYLDGSKCWKGPFTNFDGKPISGVTGVPGFVQGAFGGQSGRVELMVPEGTKLVHYWREGPPGSPWRQGSVLPIPGGTAHVSSRGGVNIGAVRLPPHELGIKHDEFNVGGAPSAGGVAMIAGVYQEDITLETIVRLHSALPGVDDWLVHYYLDPATAQWKGPFKIQEGGRDVLVTGF